MHAQDAVVLAPDFSIADTTRLSESYPQVVTAPAVMPCSWCEAGWRSGRRMTAPQIHVRFPGTAREVLTFYRDIFG
ncbi:hypothetical protein HNR05_001894 [Leifsonia psychrotolerans]|uniref:Uncharacterized protein n=1 Tax=Glaciibacter psychrotolerans TaxID=670054 RepID=A0A7Z0EEC3_9MICO|nr:hypothetical protein [Leifsonia psychrotolerans]